MSLNSRYTSIEEILERVRREFGFEDVHADDVREWIWDVMGFMAVPSMFIEKIAEVSIRDWRGELPVDLYSLTEGVIREKDTGFPLYKSSNLFQQSDQLDASAATGIVDAESILSEDGIMVDGGTQYVSFVFPDSDYSRYYYTINNNYIFTNVKEIDVEFRYTAFPVDERYFPLIPDDPKVIRAVVWYIGERLAFKMMLTDRLSERKYAMIKQDYLFNVASARTKAHTMDIGDMENFKRRVLSLVKSMDGYSRSFR